MSRQTRSGFTLIEFIVVMAIAAILISIAAPNFRSLLADSNRRAASSGLFSALIRARSDAIANNSIATVCPRNSEGTACDNDWDEGWIVFFGDTPTDTNIVLKHEAIAKSLDFTFPNSEPAMIQFDAAGRSLSAAPVFLLCDTAGNGPNLKSRRLTLPRTGIATVEELGAC